MISDSQYKEIMSELKDFPDVKYIIFEDLFAQDIYINDFRDLPAHKYEWALYLIRSINAQRGK